MKSGNNTVICPPEQKQTFCTVNVLEYVQVQFFKSPSHS